MADPDRTKTLLKEFQAAYERGDRPDLDAIVERAPTDQRQTLRDRIDHYLMNAPRRAWDPVAYEASAAKQSVERVWESLEGVSGSWPELLPHLRDRARIRRRELVERLAAALGIADRTERVAEYYNDMEHGRLPAAGVSSRVFEALAGIVGTSAEAIRAAGAGSGPEPAGGALFARTAEPDERYTVLDEAVADEASADDDAIGYAQSPGVPSPGPQSPGVPSPDAQSPGPQSPGVPSPGVPEPERGDTGRDEVDELFTGG